MSETNTTFQGMPFNLDDLVNRRSIEGNRVEYKATWNPVIKPAVVETVCAFANDLLNLNGGYIVLGIEEAEGRPVLPPRGIDDLNIDLVQKEIRGACFLIQPGYSPVLFPGIYQGKMILVVWAPGGDNRPYQASDGHGNRDYFVRQGPQTIGVKGKVELTRQLMEMAAKVPFDDRKNLEAKVEDISPTLVKRFLHDIRSELVAGNYQIDDLGLYRTLKIISPVNSHEVPRNIGLLFFHEDPDTFFRGARVEVVQFGDDAGGDLIEERTFKGPIAAQIKAALDYLNGMGSTLVQKIPGQAEVERTVPYPYEAMEEAIVNALYHRGYDGPPEPVKIYLYPDRMEIISYPGPVAGIKLSQLQTGGGTAVAPARNRRIGEFLKELRLAEGRGTGIPKIQRTMHENGSPKATFEFDEDRTYFKATLPVHPRFLVVHALREAAHLWAVGEKSQALSHLQRAFELQPGSGALASQIIEYAFAINDLPIAQQTLARFEREPRRTEISQPFLTIARLLIDRNHVSEGGAILKRMPVSRAINDLSEAAVLKKRAHDLEGAHHLFAEAYALNPDDAKIVHEFAQTKLALARDVGGKYGKRMTPQEFSTKKRLNREAVELLRRAIALSDDPVRSAWCWLNLAQTLEWLREPQSEIEGAYLHARALVPGEPRFSDAYAMWQNRSRVKPK